MDRFCISCSAYGIHAVDSICVQMRLLTLYMIMCSISYDETTNCNTCSIHRNRSMSGKNIMPSKIYPIYYSYILHSSQNINYAYTRPSSLTLVRGKLAPKLGFIVLKKELLGLNETTPRVPNH